MPPPPQAVAASITPSASAASLVPARRRVPPRPRAPTDAPDIGPTFNLPLPSAGLAGPAPPRVPHAHRRILTAGQGR
ncbi:hypothetical protein GCM10009535_41330 [Streptomyces thermocarboxydovorans]|uniref:Uncharacterized protein n=1 Tax=Streptomyces thermocarboxydovorans TaxID=59298 RepID=A0ABN1HLJ6_9ACTN